MTFYYIYILESVAAQNFYVGFTEDLGARLKTHNVSQVSHTSKHRSLRSKRSGERRLPRRSGTKAGRASLPQRFELTARHACKISVS